MGNHLPFSLSRQKIILGWVFLALGWLLIEDQTTFFPILLALPLGGLVARLCRQKFQLKHILCGLVGGLVIAPTVLLWMAFKTGIHGHMSPDFSPAQIILVVKSTPLWTLAGGLLGWVWEQTQPKNATRSRHDKG